jgi:RNA polymerase sigma-70 factor (ECF subfamily)
MSTERLEELSDDLLVERFKETGAARYFGVLFDRYKRRVLQRCYSMLGNVADAEDVAQETFVTAFTSIHLYNGGSFQAWLLRIATTRSINHLTSAHSRREAVGIGDLVPEPNSPSDPRESQEILEVLNQLKPSQRVCLKLLWIEGCSYEEIATKTGLSMDAVRSHIQNGKRQFLQRWMAKAGSSNKTGKGNS